MPVAFDGTESFMTNTSLYDTFVSAWLLFENGRKHLLRLEQELADWKTPDSFLITKTDLPETNEISFKVRLNKTIPDDFGMLIFDVACNLRSSLDHAVYSACHALGVEEEDGVGFPFGRTPEDVDRQFKKGTARNVPIALEAILRAQSPYEAGNIALWALNSLRNVKMHRHLVKPGVATGSVGIYQLTGPGSGEPVFPSMSRFQKGSWVEGETKYEFLIATNTPDANYGVEVSPKLVLGSAGELTGCPIMGAMKDIHDEVLVVLQAIEAGTGSLMRPVA